MDSHLTENRATVQYVWLTLCILETIHIKVGSFLHSKTDKPYRFLDLKKQEKTETLQRQF